MALPGGGLTPKSATCINCSGIRSGEVPKWLRERSAKPLFRGSNPLLASRFSCLRTLIIGQLRRRPIPGPPTRGQLPAVERKNRSKPAFLTRTLSIMLKSACLYHLVALCMESSGYRLCWARPGLSFPLQRAHAPSNGVPATPFGHEHALKRKILRQVALLRRVQPPGEKCGLALRLRTGDPTRDRFVTGIQSIFEPPEQRPV